MDGLTFRDEGASSPEETTRERGRNGDELGGGRTGCVVSRTWKGRNNAAVPLLQVAPTTSSSNVFVPQNETKLPSLSCVNVRVRTKYQQNILGSVTPTPTAVKLAA